jgi:FKBP-type peptidyl-prolyl cis-trans isomerase
VGKLLDGYVFDTNIADTAKKYGLYKANKTYEPLSVDYESTFEQMSSEGSENGDGFVTGFARALKSMTYGDRAVTFFWSDLGYKDKGTDGVPAYSMLFFDLYVEEKGQ